MSLAFLCPWWANMAGTETDEFADLFAELMTKPNSRSRFDTPVAVVGK